MGNLVSIIVPVYNSELFLEKCIGSLQEQSYRNIEIILVDDGSTDGSRAICEAVCLQDERFAYYYKANGGVSDARNYGLKVSHGNYITFVDADDYVEKNYIKLQLENIEKHNCDIAICGFYIVDTHIIKSDNDKTAKIITGLDYIKSLSENIRFGGFSWNKIFRRGIIENIFFPKDVRYCEDTYFVCAAVGRDARIYYDSRPLYYYVQHNNSVTSSLSKAFNDNDELEYNVTYKAIMNAQFLNPQYHIWIEKLIAIMSVNAYAEVYCSIGIEKKKKQRLLGKLQSDFKRSFHRVIRSREISIMAKIKLFTKFYLRFSIIKQKLRAGR